MYSSREEAQFAFHTGKLHLQAPVKVRLNEELIETTVGRTFIYDVLPGCLDYSDINKVLDKKSLGKLIDKAYRVGTEKDTVLLADSLNEVRLPKCYKSRYFYQH